MLQSTVIILTTNHITLPTTNRNADQSIITFVWISNRYLILKMTSAQDVGTSVTTNNPSKDPFHPDDQIPSKYITPGFKSFSSNNSHSYDNADDNDER